MCHDNSLPPRTNQNAIRKISNPKQFFIHEKIKLINANQINT